jgi:hypothetical protein
MNTHDMTPHPPDQPEPIEHLFRKVFDLVDETIDGITDIEVDDRLRRLLAEAGCDDSQPEPPGQGTDAPPDQTTDSIDVPAALVVPDFAEEFAAAAEGVVEALTAEVNHAVQVAAETKKRAAEITVGVNAYVDAALDRASSEAAAILADAHERAARIIADAEEKASQIVTEGDRRRVCFVETKDFSHTVDRFPIPRTLLVVYRALAAEQFRPFLLGRPERGALVDSGRWYLDALFEHLAGPTPTRKEARSAPAGHSAQSLMRSIAELVESTCGSATMPSSGSFGRYTTLRPGTGDVDLVSALLDVVGKSLDTGDEGRTVREVLSLPARPIDNVTLVGRDVLQPAAVAEVVNRVLNARPSGVAHLDEGWAGLMSDVEQCQTWLAALHDRQQADSGLFAAARNFLLGLRGIQIVDGGCRIDLSQLLDHGSPAVQRSDTKACERESVVNVEWVVGS